MIKIIQKGQMPNTNTKPFLEGPCLFEGHSSLDNPTSTTIRLPEDPLSPWKGGKEKAKTAPETPKIAEGTFPPLPLNPH